MIEFVVEMDSKIYEISSLVSAISYKDALNDGCSKLEFTYVNEDFLIKNGSIIRFKYQSTDIFYGFAFRVNKGKGKETTVTAYDQLRYCKAKDHIKIKNDTVTTIVNRMCNYFQLRVGTIDENEYILPIAIQDDKTWLDIIYAGISDTLLNKGIWYALRDEFGSIAIRNLKNLQLDLLLGDESFCYDYKYNKSIDDEFYNKICIAVKGETENSGIIISKNDKTSISRYGLLQYYEVSDNMNESQALSKTEKLLALYNRESETLSLSCLGDTRIRAGVSFYASIEEIILNRRLIVRSVTHKYLPTHTMEVEAML